ncbi:toxin-antitoxin system TumE family protein [Desulfonatronum thioautotrophicum]|uniref:toxin-antitoxin system TumE family protein n=1 Tax=Desulfonatronum thioautotrophicum TaxID=617001 RepID=UPI0005EAEA61|nr:DUF6516 family protein [Desulfonatronum thioautotrophicum]
MIFQYFKILEALLSSFTIIKSYSINKKIYNLKQGYISGRTVFENDTILDFVEVKNTDKKFKIKYRYQYMDDNANLIFRYDNAPHYPQLKSFPHHKHTPSATIEHCEPTLEDVLMEIALDMREPH